jgi:hypothetical protein
MSFGLVIEERVFECGIEIRVLLLKKNLTDGVNIGTPFLAEVLFLVVKVSNELYLLDEELCN